MPEESKPISAMQFQASLNEEEKLPEEARNEMAKKLIKLKQADPQELAEAWKNRSSKKK